MEEKGIRVGRPFPPFEDWCRLSMAKPNEMRKFAKDFKDVMA
jgi:histidinol-phosphate aminotransferase